jgi:hypothetical protein
MRHAPFSLVRRRCCNCGRSFGIQIWRWSNRLFVETHGYCSNCFEALVDPTENGSKVPKRDNRGGFRPASDPTRA